MKQTQFAMAALAALASMALMVGCDNGSDDETPDGIDSSTSLIVSQDTIFLSKSGGEGSFTVTTNAAKVNVGEDADWISGAKVSLGQDSHKVVFSVDKYEANADDQSAAADQSTTYDPRIAQMTVSVGSIEKKVVVYQYPEDLLEPSEFVKNNYVLIARELEYGGSGTTENPFKIISNGQYTIDCPWWVVNTKREAGSTKYEVIEYFQYLGNYDDQPREGSIVFTLGDKKIVCKLKQKATEFDFSGVSHDANILVPEIKLGWTLADATTSATQDQIKNGLFDAVAAEGINAVRIPCSFLSAESDEVNQFWLASVDDAVKAAVDKDMKVVVSLADDGWLSNNLENADTTVLFKNFTRVWYAVATQLIDYDEHLFFEGYDRYEPSSTKGSIQVYDRLNELFVQTVRRTGANNYKRCLLVPVYDADANKRMSLPDNDVVSGRLICSFPFFLPKDFALTGTKSLWGEPYSEFVDECSTGYPAAQISQLFSDVLSTYSSFPIVINSCGAVNHKADEQSTSADAEALYAAALSKAASDNQMKLFMFDDNKTGAGSFGVFERTTSGVTLYRPKYLEAFKTGVAPSASEDKEVTTE